MGHYPYFAALIQDGKLGFFFKNGEVESWVISSQVMIEEGWNQVTWEITSPQVIFFASSAHSSLKMDKTAAWVPSENQPIHTIGGMWNEDGSNTMVREFQGIIHTMYSFRRRS